MPLPPRSHQSGHDRRSRRRGLTPRCSGLALLAAELDLVRPNWERCRRFTARVLPRRRPVPLHEAASSVARRSHDHGGARPPQAAPLSATPYLRAQPICLTFASGERLLHGRVAAIAGGPTTSCSVRCPLHSALLSGSSGSIPAPKRLPGPSHPQFSQVGASMVTHGPTHLEVPMRHRGLLVLRAAPRLRRSTNGTNPSHPGPSAVRVRPNPSFQRTRYARR